MPPIDFDEASEFIRRNHRHHRPPVGWKFGIAVNDGERIVGVVTCWASRFAAAWRAARALGYKRLITYTLKSEPGTSLLAAGWQVLYVTKGGSWNVPSRPRIDKHPLEQKKLWEVPAPVYFELL